MIQKMKIFAADIDGTLVDKGKQMHPLTREALQRLHDEGVLIGVATGRPLDRRTIDKYKEWDLGFEFDFAIGMNGGDLWEKGNEEYEHFYLLPKDAMREILTFLQGLDINAIVYERGYDQICALRMDDFMRASIERNHSHVEIGDIDRLCRYDTGKIEVHYRPEIEEEVMAVVNAHPSDRWTAVHTFRGTVEFVDPHVNKGMALEMYAERKGIPIEETIGFGDMDNDIDLIRSAGWGVCLVNGTEATKAVSDDVTEYPVEEGGIGRYLNDHWFRKTEQH